MRKKRCDGIETRRRLLEAACVIFAEKGYWKSTIAEICRLAEANVAAASYHFGGKESLYVETWLYAFEKSLKAHPPDGGMPVGAPAEKRLGGRILSLLRRMGDTENRAFEIVHQEMVNPTGLLKQAMRKSIGPIRQGLSSVVRELLGEHADEQQVRLCQMSITAQCFGPMLRERRKKRKSKGRCKSSGRLFTDDIETLAEHVTSFSLAGIKEIRRQSEDTRR